MPYVTRDPDGEIAALHATKSEKAQEELAAGDPELSAFLGEGRPSADIQDAFGASDLELIRVLEDLIAVLMGKGVIKLTDLPLAAQLKLARRGQMRAQLDGVGDVIADPDEFLLP